MLIIFGPEASQEKRREVLGVAKPSAPFFVKYIKNPGVDCLVIVDDPSDVEGVVFEIKFSDLKKEIQELVCLVGVALLDLNGEKKIIYPSDIYQEVATSPLDGELGEYLHAIREACKNGLIEVSG